MGRPKNSKNSQYWDSLPFCMRELLGRNPCAGAVRVTGSEGVLIPSARARARACARRCMARDGSACCVRDASRRSRADPAGTRASFPLSVRIPCKRSMDAASAHAPIYSFAC